MYLLDDDDARTYDTQVTYTCDSGKRMLDGAPYRTIRCDATGEWSDTVTDCRCTHTQIQTSSTHSLSFNPYHFQLTVAFLCLMLPTQRPTRRMLCLEKLALFVASTDTASKEGSTRYNDLCSASSPLVAGIRHPCLLASVRTNMEM